MEKPETGNPRKKILRQTVCAILLEKGIDRADDDVIETLTEMLGSLLVEIGGSTRNYCELAGRTNPVIGDVVMALSMMGIVFRDLDKFAFRENRSIIPAMQTCLPTKQFNILQAGSKQSNPSHIPNHSLIPSLPDPHSYIRTPTYKQPVTEYEAIREKAANQKRDIERALTRFLAKTTETESLFDEEDNQNQMFPLIACKASFPTYMAPLNPTDQIFDFEELEWHYQVANRKEDPPGPPDSDEDGDVKEEKPEDKVDNVNSTVPQSVELIDNPYLRSATVPKKRLKAE